ncbi:hypothetical protein J2X36_002117 [Methylobacterium sp. BE186]|uniref:hypothetical protein n=1 Tax=Methylobacterium sp. BE186 TaxID=2817715 RepID=UPI002865B27B|nr:hypothetical protein [Methylobacterium sp. BE186]MDR7037370.1 hypothetical protein [Methylobacterium sp. BE186]
MSIRPIALIEEAQNARVSSFASFSDPVPGSARHSAGVERHLRKFRPLTERLYEATGDLNLVVAGLADRQFLSNGDIAIKKAFADFQSHLVLLMEAYCEATRSDEFTSNPADASDIEDMRLAMLDTFEAIREGRAS